VFVALVIQHVTRMRPTSIVICGLSGSTLFVHISHKQLDFRREKKRY